MGAYKLAEIAVDLIEKSIKQNIATTLANVRQERSDPIVTTEVPREYFQYETAHVYRPPAIFTIIKGQDFRNQQKGANFINALDEIIVALVVEDRVERLVVKKAWRYQCALIQILHEVALTNEDGSVKLFSRVQSCEFSGNINIKDEKTSENVFRKEMSLRLQVEHVEALLAL